MQWYVKSREYICHFTYFYGYTFILFFFVYFVGKISCWHEDIGYGVASNLPTIDAAMELARKASVTDARKRALRIFGEALGGEIANATVQAELQQNKKAQIYKRQQEQYLEQQKQKQQQQQQQQGIMTANTSSITNSTMNENVANAISAVIGGTYTTSTFSSTSLQIKRDPSSTTTVQPVLANTSTTTPGIVTNTNIHQINNTPVNTTTNSVSATVLQPQANHELSSSSFSASTLLKSENTSKEINQGDDPDLALLAGLLDTNPSEKLSTNQSSMEKTDHSKTIINDDISLKKRSREEMEAAREAAIAKRRQAELITGGTIVNYNSNNELLSDPLAVTVPTKSTTNHTFPTRQTRSNINIYSSIE